MLRTRFPAAACLLALAAAPPAAAQLPMPLAPSGTLRIELGAGFFPVRDRFADGTRAPLGSALEGDPLAADRFGPLAAMEARLGAVLGRPAAPQSLGAVTAEAEWQRGVGTIGLGWGITRRFTLAARVPIVSRRTQLQLALDGSGATVGINPADPALGGGGAIQQNATFLSQVDAALDGVATRLAAGDFDADPGLRALAEATLASGRPWRDAMDALLGSSPVLPTLDSEEGNALLASVEAYRTTLRDAFGADGFTAAPALPAAPMDGAAFAALLGAPTGLGLRPGGEDALVSLGDVEVELTALLTARGAPGDPSWLAAWAHGGVALPTGSPPRPDALLDQGSGDGVTTLLGGAAVEMGRGRFGARLGASLRVPLAGEREARIGPRDAAYRAAGTQALLTVTPGRELSLVAQPFVRVAPNLAISGLAAWWSRADDAWRRETVQAPPGTLDPSVMNAGTGADALRLGLGLSYSHPGRHRDGTVRMPVEAAFGLERTVRSGSGVVSAPLTARVTFRVYKALTGSAPTP